MKLKNSVSPLSLCSKMDFVHTFNYIYKTKLIHLAAWFPKCKNITQVLQEEDFRDRLAEYEIYNSIFGR